MYMCDLSNNIFEAIIKNHFYKLLSVPISKYIPTYCSFLYRMVGNFSGVLIFAIFVVYLADTKISTDEN